MQLPLCFDFSYVQPITQHYKQRIVLESSLQSIQSPQKIMDDSYLQTFCREAMHCSTANQHLGLSAKGNRHKGKSMMHMLYVLWYAKRHVLGQNYVEQ